MSARRVLVVTLVAQLALAAFTWWPTQPPGARRPMFDVPRDAIEEIDISAAPASGASADAKPASVALVRQDDGWRVHSAADYPASPAKVDGLLDSLLGLTTTGPIATHVESHEALKVGDASYGRRIRLVTKGGDTSEWLVGAATSRSVNLRQVGENDVYRATGASEWSFRDDASSYYDPTYVDADVKSLSAATVQNAQGQIRFERQGDAWTLADIAPGETADPDKIDDFLTSLVRVRMTKPVGAEVEPDQGFDGAPRIDWTVAAKDQSISGGYAVGALVDGQRFVKAVDRPFVVRAREASFQRLLAAKRGDFLQAGPPGESGPQDPQTRR